MSTHAQSFISWELVKYTENFVLIGNKKKCCDNFSDRDGKLALSPKQKQRFARWVRPEDFCENPQMIYAISSFSIRQVRYTSTNPSPTWHMGYLISQAETEIC